MSKPRARRLPKDEWARHKDCISDMYISHSASLKDVLDYLHENGLNSTEHQLRQQLKKWGLKKNIDANEWGRIAHLVHRRKSRGKDTVIIRNRRYYSVSRIVKETRRHCTLSDKIRFDREPTPECPTLVTLNTPRPMLIDITWPCTLPWLQFGNQYASLLERGFPSFELNTSLGGTMKQLAMPADLLQLGVFETIDHTLSSSQSLNSSCLVAHNLPHDAPGQAISILAYILSNNHADLFDPDYKGVSAAQFEFLCSIFISGGLLDLGSPSAYSSNHTAAAVLENLLQLLHKPWASDEAVTKLGQKSITLISWALQSPPKSFTHLLLTRIHDAMMEPLRPRDYGSPRIHIRNRIWFIEEILSYSGGASGMHLLRLMSQSEEAKLLMAALNQHPPRLALAQTLLRHMPTLSEMTFDIQGEKSTCIFAEISPLVCAAFSLEELVASSTIKLIQSSRGPQRFTACTERLEVMLALCYRGHNSLLDEWMRNSPDFDVEACNAAGFTVLHAAVLGCQSNTCEKLLRMGAKVHTPKSRLAPPLYFSLGQLDSDLDISILLAQWSARIDCKFPCPVHPGHRYHSLIERRASFTLCLLENIGKQLRLDVRRFTLVVALCTSLHPDEEHQSLEITSFIRQALQPPLTRVIFPRTGKAGDVLHYTHAAAASSLGFDVVRDMEVVHTKLKQVALSLGLVPVAIADGGGGYMTKGGPRVRYDSEALLRETEEACQDGSELLAILLAQRPLILVGDEYEATAIAIAALQSNSGVLQALLEALPPTICDCVFETLYCSSSYFKYFDKFEFHSRDLWGVSPLDVATLQKPPNGSFETLLNFGFRPKYETIVFAVSAGRHDLVRRLLKERNTWDTKRLTPMFDFTPLDMAVRNNDGPMVQLLIDHGEDVNNPYYQQVFWGRSSLQWAVSDGMASMVDVLLKAGAEVNQEAAERGGATAVQLAAISGYMDLAKILLEQHADVNAPRARREHGRTALQGAAEHGRLDMVALLLSSGVQTQGSYRDSFIAAVALARKEDHWVVESLLRDRCGWTPEDEAGLELLVSRNYWDDFSLEVASDDSHVNSQYPRSESDESDYQTCHHLDTAARQENGRGNEPLGSGYLDIRTGVTFSQEFTGRVVEDITEDEVLCFHEAGAGVVPQAPLPEVGPDSFDNDKALDETVDVSALQEGSTWPAFDANEVDGEMTNPFQHPSFDDETWAEAAAPYMNDGFWYGPPL